MDTTISAQLRHLAHQLRRGAPPTEVAAVIDDLARRNLVALPVIDPDRDDTRHWRRLDDDQLRRENVADAWNLAAGLHEDTRRDHAEKAGNAAVATLLYGRAPS